MKLNGFTIGLLVSFILSAVAHYIKAPFFTTTVQFIISCIAIIFVAGFLGKATESVAHYSGERLGGFLNATFGNAAELIISIFLVKDGMFGIVKASITGSIIGNLLLVLGLSLFLGGLKFKEQKFNQNLASYNSSLMLLACIALFVPAIFASSLTSHENSRFSLIVSVLLIVAYLLWLLFSMVTHKNELADEVVEHGEPAWSKGTSILMLFVATVMVAFESEWLVSTIESVAHQFGLSELFIGAFLIAIIGNAAEHSAAVLMARKNRIGAAVEIAVGSSLQIALFVSPVLVLVSFLFGNPMNLVFTTFEIAAIGVAALIAKSISQDGRTNWYEGVLLIVVYLILGIAFFLV
ncbi:calcium/proton exchanger [Paenibacillus thalictri]|uniref:Ca(2+)/H(+) antiporter n=1 Tax=Paenibacillus thalictri TaxID=2527873 RepID=A0A4Q9DT75_9BACL|nr:calcium/proton exchanger [Paenibacillus thalictri]TBL78304.1 calcium/proton exchanger [Paenibacillus thalictri]